MLRSFLKLFFRSINIEVSLISKKTFPRFELIELTKNLGANIILDVGANVGQFATEIRKVGYKGKIVSFEPLPSEHEKLKISSGRDELWIVHDQCAIGSKNGEVVINISGNSVSSSILPMSKIHETAAQNSSYISKIKVPLRTLDTVGMDYITNDSRCFVKIDTQGYEWEVLEGASTILRHAVGVQIELSLVQLYEGQPNWMEVITRMENLGFKLWKLHPGFTNPSNGQLLQCDGTFIRSDLRLI